MTTLASLYAAILRDPASNLPREIYADFLDERGHEGDRERAEFIRVQIELATMKHPQGIDRNGPVGLFGERERRFHKYGQKSDWGKRRDAIRRRESELWVKHFREWFGEFRDRCVPPGDDPRYGYISRGFPSAVAVSMALLMGGSECRNCGGAGDVLHPTHYRQPCKECGDGKTNGTGRVPGLIDTIFSQWPIGNVKISDAVIHPSGGNASFYLGGLGIFPKEYWRRLDGLNSPSEVRAALSEVCVDLGRERAGLPAIRRHGHDADAFHEQRKRIEQFQE